MNWSKNRPQTSPVAVLTTVLALAAIVASPEPIGAHLAPQDPPILKCWKSCNAKTTEWLKKQIAEGSVPTADELLSYLEECLDECMNPVASFDPNPDQPEPEGSKEVTVL